MPEITMNMPELPMHKGRPMDWTGERRTPIDGEHYAKVYYDGEVSISRAWGHQREEWIVRRTRWMPKQGENCWFITDDIKVDNLPDFVPSKHDDINFWKSREAAENARDAVVKLLESLDPETGLPWADGETETEEETEKEYKA